MSLPYYEAPTTPCYELLPAVNLDYTERRVFHIERSLTTDEVCALLPDSGTLGFLACLRVTFRVHGLGYESDSHSDLMECHVARLLLLPGFNDVSYAAQSLTKTNEP